LHNYWNDPNLNENERFIRDFILNKRYVTNSDNEETIEDNNTNERQKSVLVPSKVDENLDQIDFSEDENIIQHQELFEKKYNFRYEEPDTEFIKTYPRTIADSMRRIDSKRKEKREEYKQRKEQEKKQKKDELKHLKNLKKREIMLKLEKIKKITGNDDLQLEIDDLDKDFDPDEHEKKMEVINLIFVSLKQRMHHM
jgi:protein KRI1